MAERTRTEHNIPPIVGIDTNSFGFHAVSSLPILMPGAEDAPGDGMQTLGWIVAGAKDSYDRLRIVRHVAVDFFKQLPSGTRLFVEEALILPKNIETTRKLVLMTGVLYGAFLEARPDATWFWVDVSTWRKNVLAPPKGTAPRNKDGWKALAKLWVSMQGYEVGEFETVESIYEREPDLCDAHCLMVYGQQVTQAEGS